MQRVNQRENNLLGKNIKRLRLKNHYKNKDVIAQLQLKGMEVYTSTYSKVEAGVNNPSVDMLIALTEIFDCDFNEFFKPIID